MSLNEIRKNTHPKNITALFRDRVLLLPEPGVPFAVPEPYNPTPMAVNSTSPGSPHVLRAHMGVHRTCGEVSLSKSRKDPRTILILRSACFTPLCYRSLLPLSVTALCTALYYRALLPLSVLQVHLRDGAGQGGGTRPTIRFRPPTCTYAPWGVRVDELAKSRETPTRKILIPLLFFVCRCWRGSGGLGLAST